MTERALASSTVPQTYAELRKAVEDTLLKGQRAIDHAKLLTYHETGRLINAHVRVKGGRADYGARVIKQLAGDLQIARTTLYQCSQFADYFPIVRARGQLTWVYYRTLCQVADAKERTALLEQTIKNDWTSAKLEEHVRAFNATPVDAISASGNAAAGTIELLKPNRGTPGVYRVAAVEGALVVDLGFACYFDLSEEQAATLKEGDLVQLDGNDRLSTADGATKADLFNYRVEIIKVVDGDTLWVKIYLRPRQWLKQKLRLRGLDCPEISTPEGKAAKRFVEALEAKTTAVTVNTTKPDKYDRYLADVFLDVGDQQSAISDKLRVGSDSQLSSLNPQPAADGGLFLNNVLLENGQAVRKDKWEFGDWEPDLV